MKAAVVAVIGFALLAASLAPGQAPVGASPPASAPADAVAKLTFDVISIKQNVGGTNSFMRMNPDGFTATNIAAHMLLTEAFQVSEDQVLGEPAWTRSINWDINAKVAGEDVPVLKAMTFDERRSMFRQILEERFGLKVHHETRDLPVFALVVAKGGSKLKDAKLDPEHPVMPGSPGRLMFSGRKLEGGSANMQFLAVVLARPAGRKVIDRTGLTGRYDFTLTWGEDNAGGGGPMGRPGPDGGAAGAGAPGAADPVAGEAIFTALEEQLGLKLEPVKAPLDVVVIDHLDKPSEN
jgi:uncharacterized protein (TIGR03435 family)